MHIAAHLKTYGDRAEYASNPTAKLLLQTMERKKTNLAVGVDVTKSEDFLGIIEAVGPYVCIIKTHIDIIEDFHPSLIKQMNDLSQKYDFLFFEDRKFADIGNTVALQYSSGIHSIASWAHITNAHPIPGPSIVKGLSSVGLPLGRGLLLLSEMSTTGSLAVGAYTDKAVQMARQNREFVIGFIAQRRMDGVGTEGQEDTSAEDFLLLTPGIGLESTGDAMGQQYKTPRAAVLEFGSDVIIVGRGIYGKPPFVTDAISARARHYMSEGWIAYLDRLSE